MTVTSTEKIAPGLEKNEGDVTQPDSASNPKAYVAVDFSTTRGNRMG